MRYPIYFDGSHVTDLFRSDLCLFVGYGLILRLSSVCQERIRQFCVQSIAIHYALSDLFNPWARGTLQKLVLSVIEKSLRQTSTGFYRGRFDDYIYISGNNPDTCDGGIIRMQ